MHHEQLFCCRCGAAFRGEPKTSFLGNRKFICACGHKSTFPPGRIGRIIYGCLLAYLCASFIWRATHGQIPFPGGLGLLILFGSTSAWSAYERVKRARKFHEKQGTLGKGVVNRTSRPLHEGQEPRRTPVQPAKLESRILDGLFALMNGVATLAGVALGLAIGLPTIWLVCMAFLVATSEKSFVLKGQAFDITKWAIILLIAEIVGAAFLHFEGKRK